LEVTGEGLGLLLVECGNAVGTQFPGRSEVASLCDSRPVQRDEPGFERAGIERRQEIPVLGRRERHALTLTLHDEPRRDRLHTPGRQASGDLLPEHR